MKPKTYFKFDITKWDNTGNVLLEFKQMTVQRQTQWNAKTVVRKKYPPCKGYFEELRTFWVK